MKLSNKTISYEVHKMNGVMKITDEASSYIVKLFQKYENVTKDEFIDSMIGLLKEHAQKYVTVKDAKLYVLREIIELSINVSRDAYMTTITLHHVMISIHNDEEIGYMFEQYKLPIVPNYQMGDTTFEKHKYPIKKNINGRLKDIKMNIDARHVIYNLIVQCNKYNNAADCIEKLKSFGEDYDGTLHPITRLREIVLDKMNEKMKLKNRKITLTILNDIMNEIISENENYKFLEI